MMFILIRQNLVRHYDIYPRAEFKHNLNPLHLSQKKAPWPFVLLVLLIGLLNWRTAEAETFNNASAQSLNNICPAPLQLGDQLQVICTKLFPSSGPGVNSGSSGVGSQSQPNSFLIAQQQLINKKKKENGDNANYGSSSDTITSSLGDKFDLFLTSGATALKHRHNDYEQGYNATIPSVTLGAGYHISNSLETGLAFNYYNSKADDNTGGGFNVDAYSPLLYINYLPFDNAFTSLILGYTRQNQSNKRVAVATNKVSGEFESRLTSGNLNANLFDLNFLAGYDHPVDSLTIGPRIGVDVRQWEMDSYQESSLTGLELSYNSQYQTSIQSRLGLAASYAHSTSYGVLVPQLTASWVHEYSNNQRTITSKFIQAPDSQSFGFQTEVPARNWASIDLGVSFVMPKGVQVFANLSTVQGNRNFESYGGNVGVQMGW
jgi:uncharacterized protein YhjY with autotransporter beta-barrel domain